MSIINRTGNSLSVTRSRFTQLPTQNGNCLYPTTNGDIVGPISFAWGSRYTCFFKAKIFSTPLNAARLIAGASGDTFLMLTSTSIQANHRGSTATSVSGFLVYNQWHEYAIVYDGDFCSFYRDGVAIDNKSQTTDPLTTSQNYYIFNGSDGLRPCDMYVAHFQFYSTNFSPDDIAAHYRSESNTINNLQVYYALNEGTGTQAKDSSGNFRHATISGCTWKTFNNLLLNSPTYPSVTIPLQRNLIRNISSRGFISSLFWDGTNGILTNGNSNSFTGDLTFGCWMYWKGPNNGYQTIFAKRDSYDVSNLQFSLNIISSSVVGANNVANDTINSFVSFGKQLPQNRWFYFSWVRNTSNSTEKIYVDGQLLSSQTIGTFGNGTNALISIGATQSPSQDWFNGYIKEISIYQNALTQNDLIILANGGSLPYNPWSYMKLNEGSGTTATDSGPYGNNGTIDSASWTTFVPTGTTRTAVNINSRISV